MITINNYRFGAYALFAMGLINLRYQTGSDGNLSKSSVLIAVGAIALALTFIPKVKDLNATIEFKYSCNKNNFIGLDDENKLYRITLEEL